MTDAGSTTYETRRADSDVRSLIREVIGELAPNPDVEVTPDTLLVDELEYTSLALLELAFTLEDEFDLEPIDEETARGITTVGAVENHVLNELRERGDLIES